MALTAPCWTLDDVVRLGERQGEEQHVLGNAGLPWQGSDVDQDIISMKITERGLVPPGEPFSPVKCMLNYNKGRNFK